MRKNFLLKSFLVLTLAFLAAIDSSIHARNFVIEKSKSVKNIENREKEIFALINRERRKKNLSELKWRGDLSKMARNYSEKMARERFFSHYERSGADVVARAGASKIRGWRKIGENLFYYEDENTSSSFVVKKWMQSPTHRANILDQRYTAAGLGIAKSRDGAFYITQVFIEE